MEATVQDNACKEIIAWLGVEARGKAAIAVRDKCSPVNFLFYYQ